MGLTVVLPAYNESERLPSTLAEIESFYKENRDLISQVIVVDDGSVDNGKTIESAIYYMQRIPLRIEQLSENQGKWAAIRTGINLATTDAVLILDADGSASISELRRITDLDRKLKSKIAIFGSRFMKGSSVYNKTFMRQIMSRIYRSYVTGCYRLATGRADVDDMQAPWKLIYKSSISDTLVINRFAGDIELAIALSCPIENHPLQFVHKAGSKVKLSNSLIMAKDTLSVAFSKRYNK